MPRNVKRPCTFVPYGLPTEAGCTSAGKTFTTGFVVDGRGEGRVAVLGVAVLDVAVSTREVAPGACRGSAAASASAPTASTASAATIRGKELVRNPVSGSDAFPNIVD